jgi:hypothetical protein
MRRLLVFFFIFGFIVALTGFAWDAHGCTTIKEGTLTYSASHYLAGQPLETGYDPYGYNYQAHMFNGSYFNVYAGAAGFPAYEGDDVSYLADNPSAESHWAWPYRDITLQMKWSDEWLSNKDCNGDGKLDRGYICDPVNAGNSACEGARETNHQSGSYEVEVNGKLKEAHWTYFVKIVAVPNDAYMGDETVEEDPSKWYNAEGQEIGPAIWGSFAKIQMVENDPFAGLHGKQYTSPAHPGFGQYQPE